MECTWLIWCGYQRFFDGREVSYNALVIWELRPCKVGWTASRKPDSHETLIYHFFVIILGLEGAEHPPSTDVDRHMMIGMIVPASAETEEPSLAYHSISNGQLLFTFGLQNASGKQLSIMQVLLIKLFGYLPMGIFPWRSASFYPSRNQQLLVFPSLQK